MGHRPTETNASKEELEKIRTAGGPRRHLRLRHRPVVSDPVWCGGRQRHYVKNGDLKLKSAGSNGANTSRLGVRGIEDLGSGLKAGFWLETGLNPDTGTLSDGTRFWSAAPRSTAR